jgi:hypothetical protein
MRLKEGRELAREARVASAPQSHATACRTRDEKGFVIGCWVQNHLRKQRLPRRRMPRDVGLWAVRRRADCEGLDETGRGGEGQAAHGVSPCASSYRLPDLAEVKMRRGAIKKRSRWGPTSQTIASARIDGGVVGFPRSPTCESRSPAECCSSTLQHPAGPDYPATPSAVVRGALARSWVATRTWGHSGRPARDW